MAPWLKGYNIKIQHNKTEHAHKSSNGIKKQSVLTFEATVQYQASEV